MFPLRVSVDVPSTTRAPVFARRLLRDVLKLWGWHDANAYHDIELLATEVVTNAVEHARPQQPLVLELVLSDDRLRVLLTDGSAVRPIIRELRREEPRGRGMHFVDMLAHRWGCTIHDGGKTVWFEMLDRPPPDPDP